MRYVAETQEQRAANRIKYYQDFEKFLIKQPDEELIGIRNSSTSRYRRRACEAVMKARGMDV